MAVTEYCWLQQNAPVELHKDSDESADDSLVDAMLGRGAVVMLSTSKSNEAFHSPARDCARVMLFDESVQIGAVTIRCIVVDPHGTVQIFLAVRRGRIGGGETNVGRIASKIRPWRVSIRFEVRSDMGMFVTVPTGG